MVVPVMRDVVIKMKKRKGIVTTTVKGKKRRLGIKGFKRRRPKIDDPSFWIKIKKKWWKWKRKNTNQ